MKKLFLGLVACSLALTGCGKKNNDDTPKSDSNALTPEQKKQSDEMHSYISTMIFGGAEGVEVPAELDAYFVAYSNEAAKKNVNVTKVEGYIAEVQTKVQTKEFDNAFTVFNYISGIKADGGLDDCVYFAYALGKSYLRAMSSMSPDMKTMLDPVAAFLDSKGDALPTHIYNVADAVVSAYDIVDIKAEEAAYALLGTLLKEDFTINPEGLRPVLEKAGRAIEVLAGVKSDWQYFKGIAFDAFDLAYSLLQGQLPAFVPTIVNLVKETKVLDLVDMAFDVTKKAGQKLQAIPAAYYTHLGEIRSPYENYAYAVLGLAEEMVKGESVTDKDVEDATSFIMNVIKKVYAALPQLITQIIEYTEAHSDSGSEEVYVPDSVRGEAAGKEERLIPAFVDTIINSNHLPLLVKNYLKLVQHSSNARLSAANAKDTAKGIAPLIELIVIEETSGAYPESLDLQPFANYANAVLVEFAKSEITDTFVDDLIAIFNEGYAIFAEIEPALAELTSEVAEVFGILTDVYNALKVAGNVQILKSLLKDVAGLMADFSGVFVGASPKINFSELIKILVTEEDHFVSALEYITGKVPVASVAKLHDVLKDVYSAFAIFGYAEELVKFILGNKDMAALFKDLADAKTAGEFADAIYGPVVDYFCEAAK